MKIDTRFTSIWDELPPSTPRKVPATQQEARDFYEAAESSMHNSLMKTVDAHNEMMRQSAQLRETARRKKALELQVQQDREAQREMFAEAAEESRIHHEELEARRTKHDSRA